MIDPNNIKILTFISDQGGCYTYRCAIPYKELLRFNVDTKCLPFFPSAPNAPKPNLWALVNQMQRFDLVIVQRMTDMKYFQLIWDAAHLLNKAIILEVDDDYLHLEKHNPCYYGTALDNPLLSKMLELSRLGHKEEVEKLRPQLEFSRIQGIEGYKKLLSMVDAVTVTTKELADVIRPYNKNIYVLPNNVEEVYWERDYVAEECDSEGHLIKSESQKEVERRTGMSCVPAFFQDGNKDGTLKTDGNGNPLYKRIVRVGYTGTSSHGQDFTSIERYWLRYTKDYASSIWPVYIGDSYFCDKQLDHRGRRMFIQQQPYDTYKLNIRNLDIGIAPLEPTPFNMSKSDIKAVEYSMWGIASVLPNYITYSRSFKHGETALFYNNGQEFYQCLEVLTNDHNLRETIGSNARKYVDSDRLEKHQAQARRDIYVREIENKQAHSFIPAGV